MDEQLTPKEPSLWDVADEDFTAALPMRLGSTGENSFSGGSMAAITAAHLLRCLRMSGYVIKKGVPVGGFRHIVRGPKEEEDYPIYKVGDCWD